jgi:hypothetical protein
MEDLFRKIDEAAALLGEILAQPSAEVEDLAQTVRVQGLELCQLLEAQSEEAWCEDPVAGVELARIAVEISGRLDAARYGQSQVEDAQATAWAFLGNAYRVVSDLRRAEEALDQAEAHLERSGGEALALFQKAAAAEQVDRALLDQIAAELWRSGRRLRESAQRF